MKRFFVMWLPIFFGCHQRADRSFYYKGKQFPICARCTGEGVGMLLTFFLYYFIRSFPAFFFVLLLIPMIIDGLRQNVFGHESNNRRRFITGILFGIGFSMLFVFSIQYTIRLGNLIGELLRIRLMY